MGNCCRSQSSTLVWAGEDWGSFTSKHGRGRGGNATTCDGDTEKQSLLCAAAAAAGEVKMKMTKRELKELVKKLEMEGLSLEEVLGRIVNSDRDEFEVEHHRSWRPSLQSIPED